MKISILYDNQSSGDRFQSGWGFSCLVDDQFLFDTGEAPEPLLHNMGQMNVSPEQIEAVIVSHNHWDHTGGLWEILKIRPNLKVYGCPGFGPEFQKKVQALGGRLILCSTFKEVCSRIAVTGEIQGQYKAAPMPEQALILESADGLVVITGCSHPGIITMVECAKESLSNRPIGFVLGGFHLMDTSTDEIQSVVSRMRTMGIQKVGPTHCTGEQAKSKFRETFGKECVDISAGLELEI